MNINEPAGGVDKSEGGHRQEHARRLTISRKGPGDEDKREKVLLINNKMAAFLCSTGTNIVLQKTINILYFT